MSKTWRHQPTIPQKVKKQYRMNREILKGNHESYFYNDNK